MNDDIIDLDEFKELPEDREEASRKEIEILTLLEGKAASTTKVRDELEIGHTSAYSRLARLQDKGFVQKAYRGKKCFWALTEKAEKVLGI